MTLGYDFWQNVYVRFVKHTKQSLSGFRTYLYIYLSIHKKSQNSVYGVRLFQRLRFVHGQSHIGPRDRGDM